MSLNHAQLRPVPGWETKEWKGGRVKFALFALGGAVAFVAGVAGTISGGSGDRGAAAGLAAFGASMLFMAPAARSWERKGSVQTRSLSRREPPEPALVFPYSPVKARAVTLGAGAFSLSAFLMAFFGDPEETTALLWIVEVLLFLFTGAIAVAGFRRMRSRNHVALNPTGIDSSMIVGDTFVPWDEIADVYAYEMNVYHRGGRSTEPFIGLKVNDWTRVETPRWSGGLKPINRRLGADVSYPVRTLDVEPALLYWVLRYFFEHPDERRTLGTTDDIGDILP